MQMNSAPHLLTEDREEYERILDEVLHTAPHRTDLVAFSHRFDRDRLRSLALDATDEITAAADAEYRQYVKLRAVLTGRGRRGPVRAKALALMPGTGGGPGHGGPVVGPDADEPHGAGLVAVVAVLTPVLAGAAALIFLLVGYVLELLDPAPAFASTMVTVGWVFAVVAAVAILLAGAALLVTALRNGSTSLRADAGTRLRQDVELARDAWRVALVERGIVPFLKEALARLEAQEPSPAAEPTGRMPHLGYERPGFTSPETGSARTRRPEYSSPEYTSPDYDSPDFTSPESD
ncbi:hypothetical protein [Streptomyces sp. NPDC050560]|uniref:hypothetical protein n=1 Tax=Streptomyces sp. NPDC050560 TaxID=3365630 RepID=UPI00378C1FDE